MVGIGLDFGRGEPESHKLELLDPNDTFGEVDFNLVVDKMLKKEP